MAVLHRPTVAAGSKIGTEKTAHILLPDDGKFGGVPIAEIAVRVAMPVAQWTAANKRFEGTINLKVGNAAAFDNGQGTPIKTKPQPWYSDPANDPDAPFSGFGLPYNSQWNGKYLWAELTFTVTRGESETDPPPAEYAADILLIDTEGEV